MKKILFCFGVALLTLAAAKPLDGKKLEQAAARIDHIIEADLKRARLQPMPIVDDAIFVRRAYLGIIGRIPTVEEAQGFLDAKARNKRADLVDQLVASPGFDSHLFNWAGDLLRLQTRQEQFGLGWHVWLRKSLAEDKPWDELVSEMLGASGHSVGNPAVGYYLRDRNMQLDNFSNSMSVFLGRQIGCAQCHDHPFDEWTQYDYYQMAAFGGGFQYRSQEAIDTVKRVVSDIRKDIPSKEPVRRKLSGSKKEQAKQKRAMQLRRKDALRKQQQKFRQASNQFRPLFKDFNKNSLLDSPNTFLKLPEDYQYKDAKPGEVVSPETLFGERLKDVAPEDRRDAFADWVTSPDNPYFTKVIVNRMWARAFGYGLVEPIDDWSRDTTPSHPEALGFLETAMKGVDYDLRQFLRILYRTKLFQRESLPSEPAMGMPLAFQGPVLTRMSAEQLFDSFLVLTGGEINDGISPKLGQSWASYQQQVNRLVTAETRDLVILAESVKQGEEARRKAQAEQRAAQKAIAEASNAAERKKAQQAAKKARERYIAARAEADPLKAMAMQGMRPAYSSKDRSARASEHPTPFNPATLVRQFGGSDRATPSSSDTTATVPQALALLNSYQTDIISGKKSQLGRTLLKIEKPSERIDHLFLTLYARPATSVEHQRYDDFASNPIALRDLGRAMLTSNRFLFVE